MSELTLARACADGDAEAWERFLHLYRGKLYAMALSMTRDAVAARELADSLLADLFGTRSAADGQRVSKLASYSGRGSLEGWLRAVMAREYVNQCRSGTRLVSYEAQEEAGAQFATLEKCGRLDSNETYLLTRALDSTLAELRGEARFLLISYYLDGRTPAAIAVALRVHESTVSRRIDRITRGIRTRVIRELRKLGVDSRRAKELLDSDFRDVEVDVRQRLMEGA